MELVQETEDFVQKFTNSTIPGVQNRIILSLFRKLGSSMGIEKVMELLATGRPVRDSNTCASNNPLF